jgi:NAD(P)-dependent dehydrogenase (short-subunit alcohol dehydrogenase family)
MTQFAERVALVTGAGSGIGHALTLELARRGAIVVASDIDAERIEATSKDAEGLRGSVDGLVLDVTDPEAVDRMVGDSHSRYGRIDYLFNNAGIAVAGEVQNVTLGDWRRVLDVNLDGVIHGVVSAYGIMVEQGFGHIINTASVEGLAPFPTTVSYVASKHAVVGLSTALRVEGAELGVKVSAVCPGLILTRIFEDTKFVDMNREELLEELPEWLGVTPDECARRILRGVERNRAIIPITGLAWVLWGLMRISPNLVMRLQQASLRRARARR